MRIILLLFVFALSENALAGRLLKFTAEYYRAVSDKYINQKVRVFVSEVNRSRGDDNLIDGHRTFNVYTYFDGKGGGWIEVAVPINDVERFVRKYGTSSEYDETEGGYETKPLRGILEKDEYGDVFIRYEK